MKPTEQFLFLTQDGNIFYLPFIGKVVTLELFEFVNINN